MNIDEEKQLTWFSCKIQFIFQPLIVVINLIMTIISPAISNCYKTLQFGVLERRKKSVII